MAAAEGGCRRMASLPTTVRQAGAIAFPTARSTFLAEGEVLTLTYTATVDDGHGGARHQAAHCLPGPAAMMRSAVSGAAGDCFADQRDHRRRSRFDRGQIRCQWCGRVRACRLDLTDAHARLRLRKA